MGSGASKPSPEQLEGINIVIIGCGYAGLELAAALTKSGLPFTLIEPKEYMHHCVAALRASVNPDWVAKTAIPLKEAFGDHYVQGRVRSLDTEARKVVLEEGQEISFSHCVISVGSLGPWPARSEAVTLEELEAESRKFSEAVAEAGDIVIVGGGPVGVEMAGEIRDKHGDKNITVVSSSDKLVSKDFDDKFQTSLKAVMDRRKVTLKVGKVTNLKTLEKNKVVKQTVEVDGDSLEADLVISCIGLPPNRSSVEHLVGSEYIDEAGRIKVNPFLQVEGLTNIYAVGDCCDTKEDKMAAFAGKHGENVAANLLKEVTGCGAPSPYKQPFVGMLVPFGAGEGVGMFNGFHIPSFVGTKLKYADLFTGQFWKTAGLKVPQ